MTTNIILVGGMWNGVVLIWLGGKEIDGLNDLDNGGVERTSVISVSRHFDLICAAYLG